VGIRLDIRACDRAGSVLFDSDDPRRIAVVLDDERLDVEHDVGNVFQHAGNGRELVLRAADLDLRDDAAFQDGKQAATQTVPDRRAEAALERLRNEFAVSSGERRRIDIDDARKLKAAPADMHISSPSWL